MIRRITSILNESVTAIPVGQRVPFAEVIGGVPSVHAGGGQFVPVINDNAGGVSYWRANGAQQVQQLDRLAACGDAVRVSVPVALVAFVRREQCDAPDALLNSAAHQINASLRSIRDSMQGAFAVNVSSMTLGIDLARTNEIKDFVVPSSLAVLTLAAVIHIDATPSCLEQCGDPYDLVCAVIDGASNAKVVDCLGPDRVAEICDIPPPEACPLTWTVRDGEGNILASGTVTDPCLTPVLDVEVDCAGECAPLTWTLVNTDDDPLDSGSVTDPCGAALPLIAPDATVTRDGSPFGAVPSGGTIDVPSDCPCDPLTITINGSDFTVVIDPCGDLAPIEVVNTGGTRVGSLLMMPRWEVPDGTYQLKDSGGTDIGSPGSIPSGTSENITAPDGTVTIKNLGGTTLGSQAVKSNGAIDYIAPIPLKFGWGAGDADTLVWTVTSDEAGTYGTYTPTGTNGTITYSKNGGGYAALSGSIVLAVSDTITVRRTTTTNAGSVKWAP